LLTIAIDRDDWNDWNHWNGWNYYPPMEHSPTLDRVAIPQPIAAPRLTRGHFIMAAVLLSLGYVLVWPVLLLLINSFNAASDWFVEPRRWGVDHWVNAFQRPGLLRSLGNSLLVWSLTVSISFPIGVSIAWLLARTKIPCSHALEFLFWVSYMVPSLPTTIAWITLLDPDIGMINVALKNLFNLDQGPFNIFSVPGIVWANLMGHGISIKVMLLTPAFRNMDSTLEEAARVGGASNLRTLFKVTLPLMISPMIMVFALQLLRAFQSFETEYLLGMPFSFYVYSTKIYALVRNAIPNYGEATVLASLTLLMIALIIPLQRWILERRRYTTITGSFRPGLIVELHRLRHSSHALGAADHRPHGDSHSRQLHAAHRLLRLGLHAGTLAPGAYRSGVCQSSAHDFDPGTHGGGFESADLFRARLHSRAHTTARTRRT
jgi:ABC-type Fe3+ transport system permease subunit